MAESREHPLSLAFMRGHPVQAARVLEALPAADVAQMFTSVPARLGAAVLAAMLPNRAALCIAALEDARTLELLATMGTQPMVALLRHLPELRRQDLIGRLPAVTALASTLLLGYAEDTLGAWADPDVLTLSAKTRVADALAHVRVAPPAHPVVFVADGELRLAGTVSLQALIQAPGESTLATLMRRSSVVLAAHAPLLGTAEHPGWEQCSLLPVVETSQRLVGVLTHDALARALKQAASPGIPSSDDASLTGLVARGYWQALSGLIDGGLFLLPRVAPVLPLNEAHTSTKGPSNGS